MGDRWQESFELGSPRSGPRYSTSFRGSLFAQDVSREPLPRLSLDAPMLDATIIYCVVRASANTRAARIYRRPPCLANSSKSLARCSKAKVEDVATWGCRGRIQPARISATRAVEEGLPRRPCFLLAAFCEGTKCPGPRNTDNTPLIVFGLPSRSTLSMTGRCW